MLKISFHNNTNVYIPTFQSSKHLGIALARAYDLLVRVRKEYPDTTKVIIYYQGIGYTFMLDSIESLEDFYQQFHNLTSE